MSVELEEADLPLAEAEEAPLAPEKRGAAKRARGGGAAAAASSLSPSKRRKNNKKKNQPGKYSQLVVETIRKLGERNGSSLAKIYNEAKKVAWFDQQNGRTYLKYSIKALVQNDTLLQVKGTGANGSFKLNRKKLEGAGGEGGPGPAAHAKALKKVVAAAASSTSRKADKKPVPKSKKPEKKSHKKGGGGGGAAKKDKVKKAKKAAKKSAASPSAKKVKKSAKPKALKGRKA
uniref:histone H1.10 n=1 Tax=Euleptes europaea TaxID=460621 RepID=UPI0025417822|nr:histone H1.10 [Euleptes europaea]